MLAFQFLTGHVYSQNSFAWVNPAGSTGGDEGLATTVDASGNVYTTGLFNGTNTDFDPGPATAFLTAPVTSNIFVTKFDAAGNLVWAKRLGGNVSSHGLSIAVDGSGNVLTTGHFFGVADFNPGAPVFNLTSAGSEDIFVSKLDAAGDFVWAKRLGGTGSDRGRSIAVSTSGDVVITGFFNGTVDFDPDAGTIPTFISAGNQDIFVTKLTAATGALVWARQMGGTGADAAFSAVVDGTGNVLTTGYFNGSVDFDPDTGPGIFILSSFSGSFDIFISKLDAAGNFVWAQQMGGAATEIGTSITVDGSNNVYTTGHFTYGTGSPADFDPGAGVAELTPFPGQTASTSDIFISKLNSSGGFVWVKQLGGAGTDESWSIALDAAENVYTTGLFNDVADFDPGTPLVTMTSNGGADIFISKLTNTGDFVWAEKFGGPADDNGWGIDVDAAGNVTTTGFFTGTVDFAPGPCVIPKTSVANADIFLQKLTVTAPPPPVITGFNPITGPAGTTVIINGANFDLNFFRNTITFNGVAAVVTASTATSITTTVPVGTLTGPITLAIGCQSTQSADAFTPTGPCNIPTAQRTALLDLYTSTNGAAWTNNTNWLSADESTWYGITVAGCRVTEIDLSFNNLDGPLNASLANLTTLQRLKLNSNLVSGTLPASLGNLNALIELNMHSNLLFGDIPASIVNCTSLATLQLESNSLLGDIPSFLGTMPSLTSINLGFNFFSGTIPPELGNLPGLTFLSLAQNELTGNIPPELGNLGSLQLLDLSRNQLDGSIPAALGNLNALSLQLWSNNLSGSIPPEIGDITALTDLNLGQNLLSGNIPSALGNLVNLQFLDLHDNFLTGSFPATIATLNDLEIVRVQNNMVTTLPEFDDASITELAVEYNNLDFGDLEYNMDCTGFTYDPQAFLPPGGTISFVPGGTLNIPFATPGTANLYQWFKDGVPLAGFTSASLSRPGMTLADAGIYFLRVTNSIVTDLILQSRPYLVLTDPCIASTPSAGDLDASFDPLIEDPTEVTAMGILSSGKIVASTGSTTIDGSAVDGIVCFQPDGTLDGGFAANSIRSDQIIVQPDDKILTTYRFGAFDAFRRLTRLNADGTDDSGFNFGISSEFIFGIGLQNDGKILVSYYEEASPTFLARLDADGGEDASFLAPQGLPAGVIKVQSDNFILLGGAFPGGIVRLSPTGTLDATFTASTDGEVLDILIQPDNKIIIVGGFEYVNNVPHRGIARLMPDGSLDPSFVAIGISDPTESGYYFTRISRQTDGSLILAGIFETVHGAGRINVVKLMPDGFIDCSFDPGASSDSPITGLLIQADNQVLISGDFTSYGGTMRNGLARVNNGSPGPPTITNFSPAGAKAGETITITGTNFSPTPANNIVYFGATKTTVSAATPTQLTVTVPLGATCEPITATVGNLTAYAPRPFVPTFDGGSPIVAASFATHVDFSNAAAPRSINIGDLDGDGLADMVVSSQSGTTGIISVFRNTSTPGVIAPGSFAPPFDLVKLNAEREGMSLADIDGDGKLEILAVDVINNRLSVYLNLSTPGILNASSFDSPQEFNVGFTDAPTQVDVEDLDADGLPDVVTADFERDRITIVKNISSPGFIAFEPRFYILAGDGAADIAIRDLNNDDKPDLAIANELGNSVSVLENVAVARTLEVASFSTAVNFAVDTGPTKISIGDIDGDGSQDIITANLGTSNNISILRNILTGGPINPGAFASAVQFTTAGPNNSVELADLNGDGKIDIATAIPTVSPEIAVLQNTSTPGNLSLNPSVGFDAGASTFEVALGDLDNDGQTDIATANNGDNTVSVLRFNSAPTITITLQPSNAAVCEGATATFNTSASGTTNITYRWQFSPDGIVPFADIADGGGYSGSSTSSLSVTTTGGFGAGRYQCRINGDLAAEVITSNAGLAINPLPLAPGTSGASVCGGGSLILSATGATDGEYRWYTTATGGSPIPGAVNAVFTTPVLTVTTTYHVSIHNGTCESATRTPVIATVNTPPTPPSALGASSCIPTALTLTASGGVNGDYRWYTVSTGGTAIPGEVNDTYNTPVIATTTIYHVALFDGTCESSRTPVTATIEVVAKPVIITSNCTATGATLNGPAGFSAYTWSNGGNTQQISVTAAGTYTLTVTSAGGCLSPPSDPVTFTAAFCNQPPVIQPTTVTTTIQGSVTIDVSSLASDLDNNLDMTTLQVVVQPLSGATASVSASFEVVVDYAAVSFAGTDQLTIQVCDVSGACVQQVITIEVAGDITVYNALSPNGDGKNDVFYIQYIDALPETQQNRVTILNRWGTVVFEISNYDNSNNVFRGLSNSGAELPTGTYYYILEFSSGAAKRTGFLSLRR